MSNLQANGKVERCLCELESLSSGVWGASRPVVPMDAARVSACIPARMGDAVGTHEALRQGMAGQQGFSGGIAEERASSRRAVRGRNGKVSRDEHNGHRGSRITQASITGKMTSNDEREWLSLEETTWRLRPDPR